MRLRYVVLGTAVFSWFLYGLPGMLQQNGTPAVPLSLPLEQDSGGRPLLGEDGREVTDQPDNHIDATPSNVSWLHQFFDKVFMVALPERRGAIDQFTKATGVRPVLIPGIHHKELTPRKDLIRQGIVNASASLSAARVACHLGHISALRYCLLSKAKTCLFLEDDALPAMALPTLIGRLVSVFNNIPADWQLLNLGRCMDVCWPKAVARYLVPTNHALCRQAYAVTREGAQNIMSNTLPMSRPGDKSVAYLLRHNDLKGYAVTPLLFKQERLAYKSLLGNEKVSSLNECRQYSPKAQFSGTGFTFEPADEPDLHEMFKFARNGATLMGLASGTIPAFSLTRTLR